MLVRFGTRVRVSHNNWSLRSDHNHQGNLRCRQCDKVQNPRYQCLSYGDHSTQCHGGGSIPGLCPSYRALVRHAGRNGGHSATHRHCVPGQPGLLPVDGDEKGFFARRQVRERLPHISCPLLPDNLLIARVLLESYHPLEVNSSTQ
jgi:hypothetical protein